MNNQNEQTESTTKNDETNENFISANEETINEQQTDVNVEEKISDELSSTLNKINDQTKIVNNLKNEMDAKYEKLPLTNSEEKAKDTVQQQLNEQILSMQSMVNDIIKLPNENTPPIKIDLPTTIAEDCFQTPKINTNRLRYCDKTKELMVSYNMQEKLAAENCNLEGDRFNLQNELIKRDCIIDSLQHKIKVLKCEMLLLGRDNIAQHVCESCSGKNHVDTRFKFYKENTELLEKNFNNLSLDLNKLKIELCAVQKERQALGEQIKKGSPTCNFETTDKNNSFTEKELSCLKQEYIVLLQNYDKKDVELKNLELKFEKYTNLKAQETPDHFELKIVKNKCKELLEEQEHFKIIIKEQSENLEAYRDKFLVAQQTVEEQKCQIKNLEITNSAIEDQINLEIQRIKGKFQEKLKEYFPYPKLLENEQIKLQNSLQECIDLEKKLKFVSDELDDAKSKLNKQQNNSIENVSNENYKKILSDNKQLTKRLDKLILDNKSLEEQLALKIEETNGLRTETAKILVRTKDRANNNKETLQSHINHLEIELTKCRANASITVTDRENCIAQMQNQLHVLGSNFDKAQLQVKSLKNHISFLTKQNLEI